MQRMQMGSVVSKCSTNMMLGAALASRCTMQLDAAEAGCIVMQMHNSEMHFPCISICVCIVCSLASSCRWALYKWPKADWELRLSSGCEVPLSNGTAAVSKAEAV